VKIVQKWNEIRPRITKDLLIEFRGWLIQKKIDDYNRMQKALNRKNLKDNSINTSVYYQWIEKLLQTGIEDCRKVVIDLILAPYLIYVKTLEYAESYKIIRHWLDKCNSVMKLDDNENFNNRIKRALKTAASKNIGPMSAGKIKTDNSYNKLYALLKDKGILI
jgi:hypothetical protein